jgi:CHAT domain-containing protein
MPFTMQKKSRIALKISYKLFFLKNIFWIVLTLISSNNLKAQNLLDQADSLKNCGYYDQELAIRKQIRAQENTDLKSQKVNDVLFSIASFKTDLDDKTIENRKVEYLQIIRTYITSDKAIRKTIALEIGQLIADEYSFNEKHDEAISLLKKLQKTVSKKGVEAAKLSMNIAKIMFNGQQKYYESIPFYQASIAGFEANGLQNHYINASAHNDLAYVFAKAELEHEMIPNSEKALEIWHKYYFKDASLVSTSYADLLTDLMDYGDHYLAKKYQLAYESYIAEFLKKGKENYLSTNNEFSTLGMYYLSVIRYYDFEFNENKVMTALKAQEKLFDIAPKKWKDNNFNILLSSYDNASHAYYMNYNASEALRLNDIIEKKADSDFYKMKVSANRAMLYYYKYDYGTALIHTQKSLDFLEILGYRASYKTLLTLKAELQANLGKNVACQETLEELYELQFDKNIKLKNITISDFEGVNSSSVINILIHTGLAQRAIYEKSGKKKENLLLLKNFYSLAAKMFQAYYQKGSFNPTLDSQLKNINEGLLYGCVQDPSDKIYWAESINAIENNASQHLWKTFLAKHAQNINLPKPLLDKKNNLQIELAFLENRQEAGDSLALMVLHKELTFLNDAINKANPNHGVFNATDFSVLNLQKLLLPEQQLIKYVLTDSSAFALNLTSTGMDIKYLGKSKDLEKQSTAYYNKLKSINFEYENESSQLYSLLVKPILKPKLSKISIVAEGFLNYVPFESLKHQNNSFLANEYDISYTNGMKFFGMETAKAKLDFNYKFSGFAPTYGNEIVQTRSENGQLIYTGKELAEIADRIGKASLFMEKDATKTNFLSSLGKSTIHHLAMHSNVDQDDYNYSSLVFQNDEKLYFHELYNLNFPSEMVVLSACNTGIGQYLNGEGLMSMSRALNYAGVKSSVYSLWQVPDKETSDLMVLFYENIEKGMPKDAALAEAKRQFVSTYSTKTHPYFWAGFVVNGEMSPIKSEIDYLKILLMAFAAIIAIFFSRKWLFPDLKLF